MAAVNVNLIQAQDLIATDSNGTPTNSLFPPFLQLLIISDVGRFLFREQS